MATNFVPGVKQIDDRTIVVEHTAQFPALADRPEPPQPKVVWLTRAEIEKEYPGLRGDGFDQALAIVDPKFPPAWVRGRPWPMKDEIVRRKEIDAFMDAVKEKIALMQRLVG